MGNQKSQEVVIAQNAAGGVNQATTEEIQQHMSTTKILLCVIILFLCLGLLYLAYSTYKKCHLRWISRQINRATLRDSFFRRPAATPGRLDREAQQAPNKLYPGVV